MDGLVKEEKSEGEISRLNFGSETIDAPKKSYIPEGFDSVEDYLEDMRETYAADIEADADNRRAALEDKKFAAGEQWDPAVLQQRQGLPCLTINTIPQFTAQLVGDWRENKNGIKVLPAENGDKDVADVRSDLIRAIETKNRADRVYDSAFESCVTCGDGAFRIGVRYTAEDVFDQDITVEPIDDALSVVWDRLSIDPTGRDATHCFVDDLIPTKEFRERWPDADPSTLSDKENRFLSASGWIELGAVRVTEHWRMIERKRMLVMFEDGSLHAFDEDDYPDSGQLSDVIDEAIQKYGNIQKTRLAPCRYAQMHLVTGHQILAGPYEWKLNRLPIVRMAGRYGSIADRRIRYGLVRFMKDAARLRNFWRSVAAEQLGYAPKAQWMATEEAVEGREDTIRKAHQTRDPLLIFNDEAVFGQNVQRVDPPQLQMALLNEAQINTQDMKDVTGIHDASLGIKSNETSGRAIQARQREGDIASLTYYDNGNAAILEAGDVINQLIGQIYDGTRIIRIIGADEATKFVKINDPMDPKSPNLAVGNYDVAITTGASYTTRRVEAAQAMMEAIQVYPELMQIAGDIVVKAQDWPGAEELSERLQKTVPPQLLSDKEKAEMGNQPDINGMMQQQAQMQEQMQEGMQKLQQLTQENQILKTQMAAKEKENQIAHFKAETERLKVLADIAAADKEAEIDMLKHEAEIETGHLDRAMSMVSEDKQIQSKAELADKAAKAKTLPGGASKPKPSK
jgi:hypothetical protein